MNPKIVEKYNENNIGRKKNFWSCWEILILKKKKKERTAMQYGVYFFITANCH